MNIINTKEDVEALALDERKQFMQSLRGTLWRLEKDDVLKAWVATEDNSTIARFGFVRTEFDVPAPTLPLYVDTSPTYSQLRATEYNLKSTGEQFAMQYDDAKLGTTTWVDWQDGIKAAIPKI